MPKFDTNKSKVKLWVGTPGNRINGIWYSFLTEQGMHEEAIIERMTERILKKKYNGIFTKAKFYNNLTNTLIKTINGDYTASDKGTANIKLWVGFPDQKDNDTWYNLQSENGFENDKIISLMTERLLRDKYRFTFTKAMFFNNLSGMHLKTVEGNLIRK